MAGAYVQDVDQILFNFHNDKGNMDTLRRALAFIKNGNCYNPSLYLRTLRVLSADAGVRRTFSLATCEVEHTDFTLFNGGSIFLKGLYVLERYLQDEITVPVDENSRTALQKLLTFLSSSHSELTAPRAEDGESYWAMQLAEHLFSRLSVESNYMIDNTYDKPELSNMDKKERTNMFKKIFGDTSFGCCDAWHGRTDILMKNSLPISVSTDDDDEDSNVSSQSISDSSMDTKAKDGQQLIVQAVVFSFLQKQQDHILQNYLVPAIDIDSETVRICFYDCENDILLHTTKLALFWKTQTKIVATTTIVYLWLVLNYKYFCSGIVQEMNLKKANFFSIVGPFLEKYRTEVIQPCQVGLKDTVDIFSPITFEPWVIAGTPIEDEEVEIVDVKISLQTKS